VQGGAQIPGAGGGVPGAGTEVGGGGGRFDHAVGVEQPRGPSSFGVHDPSGEAAVGVAGAGGGGAGVGVGLSGDSVGSVGASGDGAFHESSSRVVGAGSDVDVNVTGGAQTDVSGMSDQASASSIAGGSAAGQAGASANSVISGDASDDAHQRADDAMAHADVSYQADVATQGVSDAEAGAKVEAEDRVIAGAGAQGEVQTYQNVQAERSYREGQVDEARGDVAEAKVASADPTGYAAERGRVEVDGRAQAEVDRATPARVRDAQGRVAEAQGDAEFARGAVADPTGTVEGEAQVKIEGEVGVDLPPKK
jgi:hypothetical protein